MLLPHLLEGDQQSGRVHRIAGKRLLRKERQRPSYRRALGSYGHVSGAMPTPVGLYNRVLEHQPVLLFQRGVN